MPWTVELAVEFAGEFTLAAGDKSGTSEKRFYRGLIATADSRLDARCSPRAAEAKVRGIDAEAQEMNLLIRWRRLWDVPSPK